MSKKNRRYFTSEEKVKILRKHLLDHKPVSDICDEYKQFSIRTFGYVYFLCQTIFVFFLSNIFKLPMSFLFILPPVIYLKKYLDKYYKENSTLNIELNNDKNNDIYRQLKITEREQEIIELMCKGLNNKVIADELYISLQTVKHHLYNVYKKLNIKNRVQLINYITNFDKSEKNG